MNTFLRNRISKLCNNASAPITATKYAIAERLQRVGETTSLLYNRVMDNIEHRRERMKDILKKQAQGKKRMKLQKRYNTTSI